MKEREARRIERVARVELFLQPGERRAGRVRPRREAGVVAEHPDRERAPEGRRAARLVQGEHVEGDRVARLELPAQDLVGGAVGLDVGHLLELTLVEDEPPTNSSVFSRLTGSTGTQNDTFCAPSRQ
jgi:hypothetical protein